jgi:hypothetical protein
MFMFMFMFLFMFMFMFLFLFMIMTTHTHAHDHAHAQAWGDDLSKKREGWVEEGGHSIKIASTVNKMMMVEEGIRGRGKEKRRQGRV